MSWRVGHEFATASYTVTRADLVRYAGASGDFNPIHWSDRVARSVGLPGVVAHGMFTLALASRALTSWIGSPSRVVSIGARFTSPVVVPDDDTGAEVTVTGLVTALDSDTATVDVTVTSAGKRVLGAARAVVRC
jgi:acyl dehydratase